MEEKFEKINQLIAESKNILIVSHRAPDGDAVSSALALKFALKKQGIKSVIFIDSYSAKEYKFLPDYKSIESQLNNYDFDLVFALDYGNWRRLSIDKLIEQKNPKSVTFDHHLDAGKDHIGEVKILSKASSTAELIYDYLKKSGWGINKNIATCILAGIISDTEGFLHSSVSQESLLAVAELLDYKPNMRRTINKFFNRNNCLEKDSLSLAKAISQIKKHSELELVYLVISNTDLKAWDKFDFNIIISTMGSIADCRWILLLVEYEKGKTKASLRSNEYRNIDVSEIAKLFGGGGHKVASAFQMNKKPKKVLKKVIRKSRKVLV